MILDKHEWNLEARGWPDAQEGEDLDVTYTRAGGPEIRLFFPDLAHVRDHLRVWGLPPEALKKVERRRKRGGKKA